MQKTYSQYISTKSYVFNKFAKNKTEMYHTNIKDSIRPCLLATVNMSVILEDTVNISVNLSVLCYPLCLIPKDTVQ